MAPRQKAAPFVRYIFDVESDGLPTRYCDQEAYSRSAGGGGGKEEDIQQGAARISTGTERYMVSTLSAPHRT
jgi:hypothetical protein